MRSTERRARLVKHRSAALYWLVPLLLVTSLAGSARAADYVVYLHGRSMNTWKAADAIETPASWTHVRANYDGSARMTDTTVRTQVRNMVSARCRGANNCIVVCYSAGCARLLLALYDLKAAGTPADKILWIDAGGSAAGGTEVASYTSKWWKRFIAKLLGVYAKIDVDLTVPAMRTTFSYIQNQAPVSMYHVAGSRDICKRFLGVFKICGNSSFQGGYGDGAVPAHSACGYAAKGAESQCCSASSKYTNRKATACALVNHDHSGMFAQVVRNASSRLGLASAIVYADFANPGNLPVCDETTEQCDSAGHSSNKTLGQMLAAASSDNNASPLSCVGLDPDGCRYCPLDEEHNACTGYLPKRTMASTFTNWFFDSIHTNRIVRQSSTRLRIDNSDLVGGVFYQAYYLDFTNGVTVTSSSLGAVVSDGQFKSQIRNVWVTGGDTIHIRWAAGSDDKDYRDQSITFSGATIIQSYEDVYTETGLPGTRFGWGGNMFGATYCRKLSGYDCVDRRTKQFLFVHPTDLGWDGT